MPSQAVLELLVELKDQASSGLSSLGSAVGNLGMVAGGVALAGVAALGVAIKGGVDDAREAQKLYASTEQTILTMGNAAGRSADEVVDLASSLSDAAGMSLFGDDQIQSASNLLLTFGEIKGETFDLATALTVDLAQALGGAPRDQAMMLGKALNDPIKGMSALGKAGLTFTEEQKAVVAAMVESGDMAGAQALIIAELNKQVGGQAAAAAEAAGGMVQFQARMGEAAETVGAALLPMLNMLAAFFVDTIAPAIETAANALSAWLADPAVQAGIAQIGEVIQTGLAVAFDYIANTAIPALLNAWALIQPAIAAILPLFTSDLPSGLESTMTTFTMLQDTISVVMAAIMGVVAAILPQIAAFWQANGADIMAFVQTTWDTIQQIIQVALQLIQAIVVPVLAAIAGFIQSHGTEIQAVLTNSWNAIKAVVDIALTLIKGVITAALQIIQGDWSGAWETIKTMSARIVTDLLSIIKSHLDTLKTIFGGALDSVRSALSGFASDAVSLGRNIINGIVDGVQAGVGALVDAVTGAANDALQAAKDALGIASPSKVMAASVGAPIIQGMIQGMAGMQPALISFLGGLSDAMLAATGKPFDKISKQFKDKANKLQGELIKAAQGLGPLIQGALGAGFDAEASIDRIKAANISAIEEVSAANRRYAEQQLATAMEMASQMNDPKQAAAFFKLRSDQIFELAELQDELSATTDKAARARLEAQINLISQAQVAEQSSFRTDNPNNVNSAFAQIKDILAKIIPSLPPEWASNSGIGQMLFALDSQISQMGSGAFAPAPAFAAGAAGPVDSRGQPTVINNTFNLPAGTTQQIADEVIKRQNQAIRSRR